mmetsp:Transcript_72540/g.151428  ORF Transcript_72540/g.151428 Transcript_72540/m.151428 type:complete len:399 (-) Transcript_72540:55-1251(-)
MDEDLEYTLLNKKDVMAFHPIPPASSANGHKADDWKSCIWRGRCRVCGKGADLLIKLMDTKEGAEVLFAQCNIPKGEHQKFVERTIDSSRYFVLKITNGARHEFIGLGFEDRNDAFDFNCTLSDFKSTWVDKEETADDSGPLPPLAPSKDLSLKDGQKITINFKGLGSKKREERPAEPAAGGGGGGFGGLIAPPPSGQSRRGAAPGPAVSGLSVAPPPSSAPMAAPAPAASAADDFGFGDFDDFQAAPPSASAPSKPAAPAPAPASTNALDQQIQGLASGLSGLSFGSTPAGAPPSSSPTAPPPMGIMGGVSPPRPSPVPASSNSFDPFAGFGGFGGSSGGGAGGGAGGGVPQNPSQGFNPMGGAAPMSSGFGMGQPAPAQTSSSGKKDPFDEFDIFK